MKKLILTSFFSVLTLTSTADAKFYNITSAKCDNNAVENSKINRIFFDAQQLVLGIGQTETVNGKECTVVDFYRGPIELSQSSTVESIDQVFVFTPASPVGRRSSCEQGIIEFKGPSFEKAEFTGKKISFEKMNGCSLVEYGLRLQE